MRWLTKRIEYRKKLPLIAVECRNAQQADADETRYTQAKMLGAHRIS